MGMDIAPEPLGARTDFTSVDDVQALADEVGALDPLCWALRRETVLRMITAILRSAR